MATSSNYCGTVLSAVEFRDELQDRYGFEILNTPSHSDGRNSKFSSTHTLSCKKGGLIYARHNESRDSLDWLALDSNHPMSVTNLKSTRVTPLEGRMKAMVKLSLRVNRARKKALIVVTCLFVVFGIGTLIVSYIFASVMLIRHPTKCVNLLRLLNRQKTTRKRNI